ncbi:MAG: DNA mismatch repair protein MutS, partial [Eubacterium sp.]|nr:DNA mismatch repair protein MutS [Eubacterium sp.]
LLFYRLGDFYEMFFEDAKTASKELEITLTGKECGMEERAPMCGVPYHAVDVYLDRLIKLGYKVAIAEQMEDPKLAKGIVKREVIRVVTPGTVMSEQSLEDGKNNYLCCACYSGKTFGLSFADVSTGDFFLTEIDDRKVFLDELEKFTPAEMIFNDALYISGVDLEDLKVRLHMSVSSLPATVFSQEACEKALLSHFKVSSLKALGLADYEYGTLAAGALMQYLTDTQKSQLPHITRLSTYQTGRFMVLDTFTRRNLELVETMREKEKRGSLLWVLDRTRTAMGARLLRGDIEQPLLDTKAILARQDAIEELNRDYITREEISEYLNPIYDLERLLSRISYKTANPRDLIAFRNSIRMLPPIRDQLAGASCAELRAIYENMDSLTDLEELISRALVEDPPILVREGGMIREGYNETVDLLRRSKTEGKEWLADLEASEKEKTGIKNLRVRFNRVFGYYIEISNSFLNMVPAEYTRKQTLTTGERFTTPRLKELEEMILGAEDKLFALEYDLFADLRDRIGAEVVRIQNTARAIARLDVYVSLAKVAEKYHYVRPKINEKGLIDIKEGRHPVVEHMLKDDLFIANDTYLDHQANRIAIITGPNMAGKSTYMRQTALIVLMAQMGSFVPASSANIAICDRIFTRVGASDDLASGQSTFMVEMTEVANILRNATRNSLLILDEIGRGTSTFDGLSIAWAVVEHIANPRIL